MKIKNIVIVCVLVSLFGLVSVVRAETDTRVNVSGSLSQEQLLEKIAELQAKIRELTQKNAALTQKLELARELKTGSQGTDVVTLQKILATDRAIYPEGLTTGFFGERTREAIKRLQEKFGLPVTGEIDEKTKELLNKILTSQGATKDIPPGLLLTPGLRDRIKVRFENKDGKFEYRIDVDDDSDDSDDNSKLEVEVESKSSNRSKVKIDWRHDGKRLKRVVTLNTQREDVIIQEVADILGISEGEVKEVIEFDHDDDSNDDSDDDSDDDDDNDDNGGRHGGDDDDDDSDED